MLRRPLHPAGSIIARTIAVVLRRRRDEPGPQPAPPAPAGTQQPLASLVVEALDHGVVVVDRDERAVLVNPAARAMGVLDVDKLAFPGLLSIARKALDTGEHVTDTVDLPIDRLGREPIALAVTAVPLPGTDERTRGVCLLLADVSEQRRLEAVRRDFVANVSHELKTPVGALTLLAEAIQDAADEPAMVARFAARIQHEGSRRGASSASIRLSSSRSSIVRPTRSDSVCMRSARRRMTFGSFSSPMVSARRLSAPTGVLSS